MRKSHNHFLNLAFEEAKINLGKTGSNPTVGCIVVKNNSVINSGHTSLNGRPHAEFNALNSSRKITNSDLYVTLEPCTHYGLTPPCANLIIKKKIKRVFFSDHDIDERSAKKLKLVLNKKNIKVIKYKNKNFSNFYEDYFLNRKKKIPYIDGKIAVSRDYFTINKNSKWITNEYSRKRAHFIRSNYNAIISTSKSINKDNSLLNCRLEGFNSNKPDVIIIDLKLKIKKNIKLFKTSHKRKIIIVTTVIKNKKKIFLKKKGIKFINIVNLSNTNDFKHLLKILKTKGYNRILVESGLTFLNEFIIRRLISNLYLFKTSLELRKKGCNNTSNLILKKIGLKKQINVNLKDDKLYKIRIK